MIPHRMNYLRKQVLLMKKTKQFLWDTAVLTIAALFMRTVGVSFNVYLTNQLGAAGIGLFQLVMTVFSMAITFASSGIRLAATRLVVDAISKDRADVKKVLRRCLLSILLVAVVVALILYTASDLISQHWLYDSRTAQPLRLLSLSLPFIAMSAALSGYFTAIRRAGVYAGCLHGRLSAYAFRPRLGGLLYRNCIGQLRFGSHLVPGLVFPEQMDGAQAEKSAPSDAAP